MKLSASTSPRGPKPRPPEPPGPTRPAGGDGSAGQPWSDRPHFNYGFILGGPGITFKDSLTGCLLSRYGEGHRVRFGDIRRLEPVDLPARWQQSFKVPWHRHPDGAEFVLDRCRTLLRSKIERSPDNDAHEYLKRFAWVCGVSPASEVPGEIARHHAWARAHHPTRWQRWMAGLNSWGGMNNTPYF